jgi:asparagine synthase (glutamine-hydrolysing)
MCGISGIINLDNKPVMADDLGLMIKAIKHRGPDDDGIFVDANVGLGFVRLSIIDLSSAGHQPMLSDDGRFVIVFNGEIFNYLELKQELINSGVSFNTDTDTEVLLKAYLKWGRSCLDKFNGMWAFAIYDKTEKTIFASRDRFGIKPFYFYRDDSRLIFCSEITGILSVLKNKPKANFDAVFDYLIFNRTDQDETTFFDKIFKLKHSQCLTLAEGKISIEEWYTLKNNLKKPFESPDAYRKMFFDAVGLRLRSDVPVGICFSGGLDSSSILAVILEHFHKDDINTFSAVYKKGETGDESAFIHLYRDKVKNMHFISPSAESLFADMGEFIKAHAEPIPSTSPYAQFKTMELAKRSVTVTLDGQGADEQLGGYHYFFGLYFKELFKSLKWKTLVKELFWYRKIHQSTYGIKTFIFFMLPAALRTKLRAKQHDYVKEQFYIAHSGKSKTSATIYSSNSLQQALIDHFEYKLEHLLKWEDRNSMHFSIEARVPFLDHRLVEQTLLLPPESIIRRGTTKYILREAMNGLLLDRIRLRQDKVGFGTPEAEWFRTDIFRDYTLAIIKSDSFAGRGIISPEKALQLFKKHLNREVDVSQEIWKWINLEIWFREFID